MSLNSEKVISCMEMQGAKVEVIEYNELYGCDNVNTAFNLFIAKQQGMKIRYVKIYTNMAPVMTDAGALYYRRGKFNVTSNKHLVDSALKGILSKESLVKPVYYGNGYLALEPSFKHYFLIKLDNSSIIIDKSMYYASIGDITLDVVTQKNISTALLSKEGIFQLKLTGTGIVVLESDVPKNEIEEVTLRGNDELSTDGNFALLRSPSVDFYVTTNTKGIVSSFVTGEGLLCTYRGNGIIWLAPTLPIYKKLKTGSISNKGSNN